MWPLCSARVACCAVSLIVVALGAVDARAESRPPVKNPRAACGCPSARILARGPQSLDGGQTVAAWLHDGAELMPFQRNADKPQLLEPIEAPIRFEAFGVAGAVPSSSRLVRAEADGPLPAGRFLGVVRRNDPAPRDVVPVSASAGSTTGAAPSAAAAAPNVAALWLAPLEERERPGCGAWLTHMIAFELRPGSPAVEAFVVTDTASGRAAVVDARAAGVFGIGNVAVCEQGLPLQAAAMTLDVRPVAASFAIGDAWGFASDGTGATDVDRVAVPRGADAERVAQPFPIPGQDEGGGATHKELAILVMGTVVGGALVIALLFFVVIPMRKRRIIEITCPSCHSKVPLDALDPKTDGFFCPSCGKAGFWKPAGGEAVDATRL